MDRVDPFTKETFVPKRSNQLFASRKNQVDYNNMIAKQKRDFKETYLSKIEHNYRVMKNALVNKSEDEVTVEYLSSQGFHFAFLTHKENLNGREVAMVFDHGFSPCNNGNIYLTKR